MTGFRSELLDLLEQPVDRRVILLPSRVGFTPLSGLGVEGAGRNAEHQSSGGGGTDRGP